MREVNDAGVPRGGRCLGVAVVIKRRSVRCHGRRVGRYREEMGGREGMCNGYYGIAAWNRRLWRAFIGCHHLRRYTGSVLILEELEVCGLISMAEATEHGMRSSQSSTRMETKKFARTSRHVECRVAR